MNALRTLTAIVLLGSAMPAVAQTSGDDEQRYRDSRRIIDWTWALAFDPGHYFWTGGRRAPAISAMIDGYSGLKWAFGIDWACPGAGRCDQDDLRVMLRLVRLRRLAPGAPPPTLKTFADVKAVLAAHVDWLEADLSRCPAGLKVLAAFGDDWRPQPFGRYVLKKGRSENGDIVISTDGDFITLATHDYRVTRRSRPDDWAFRMMTAVEPCLKPATAPAPWLRDADPDALLKAARDRDRDED